MLNVHDVHAGTDLIASAGEAKVGVILRPRKHATD